MTTSGAPLRRHRAKAAPARLGEASPERTTRRRRWAKARGGGGGSSQSGRRARAPSRARLPPRSSPPRPPRAIPAALRPRRAASRSNSAVCAYRLGPRASRTTAALQACVTGVARGCRESGARQRAQPAEGRVHRRASLHRRQQALFALLSTAIRRGEEEDGTMPGWVLPLSCETNRALVSTFGSPRPSLDKDTATTSPSRNRPSAALLWRHCACSHPWSTEELRGGSFFLSRF